MVGERFYLIAGILAFLVPIAAVGQTFLKYLGEKADERSIAAECSQCDRQPKDGLRCKRCYRLHRDLE